MLVWFQHKYFLLKWLLWQGSNLQTFRRLINSEVCLPIPPHRNILRSKKVGIEPYCPRIAYNDFANYRKELNLSLHAGMPMKGGARPGLLLSPRLLNTVLALVSTLRQASCLIIDLNGSQYRIRTCSNLINSQASLPIGPIGNV